MATVITVELPQEALQRLMEGYRCRDPKLLALLKKFGIVAIVPAASHQAPRQKQQENPCPK
jgi:hypothetical protein